MQFSISRYAAIVSKRNKFAPSPSLVQCCFGLTAQVCISTVTVCNFAIRGGGGGLGNGLLICDCKHFCQGKCRTDRNFCNVSQQILS